MIVPLILLIGIWVTAMFFAGWMLGNKEVEEDNRDYYERHNQPNPADYDGMGDFSRFGKPRKEK
jgi:flagellar basal body-associated protein FliL